MARQYKKRFWRAIEMMDFDQKADEDESRHIHCVMGSPSLLRRTKAILKNLCP